MWSQDSDGILDATEPGESFGSAMEIGDFDGDGFGDLAIATNGESVGSHTAGAVNVLYGSAAGLNADGNQLWHEDVAGVPGAAESGDHFGRALAAGDFDGDGTDDLAVGVSRKAPGGAVVTLYGSPGGLGTVGAQAWSQGSPGVPGTAERPDQFGAALAAADYGRSGRADLAISAYHEKLHGEQRAGTVTVLYGGSDGIGAANAQSWSQDSQGVRGTAEAVDRFGSALTP